jgi:hypothetical protein
VRSLLVPALISLFRPADDTRHRVAEVADSRA